jgi:hypothetical protein
LEYTSHTANDACRTALFPAGAFRGAGSGWLAALRRGSGLPPGRNSERIDGIDGVVEVSGRC